jgi:hypothetical protein
MTLALNGKVIVNGAEFWRIDDLDSGLAGLEMLANPFALVKRKEDAERIVAALALSRPERS